MTDPTPEDQPTPSAGTPPEPAALEADLTRLESVVEAFRTERQRNPAAMSLEAGSVLLDLRESFLTPHDFQPGDLVVWKESLKNKMRPLPGEPAVVMDVLTKPIVDPVAGPGSVYFRERLDMVIGLLDDHQDFVLLHCDSRRFEPAPSAGDHSEAG